MGQNSPRREEQEEFCMQQKLYIFTPRQREVLRSDKVPTRYWFIKTPSVVTDIGPGHQTPGQILLH